MRSITNFCLLKKRNYELLQEMEIELNSGHKEVAISITATIKENDKKLSLGDSYEPEISVRTSTTNDMIKVKIRDNGNGISQKILDKIFQPFFTTKPSGEGSSLGLLLTYDIIKAHGGTIKAETVEGGICRVNDNIRMYLTGVL